MTKQKKYIFIGVAILAIVAFGKYNEAKQAKIKELEPKEVLEIEKPKTFAQKFEEKNFSEIRGGYKPVREYLKKNLDDPSSLEIVNTWNLGMNKDSSFAIKTTFRSKNQFNATVLQAFYCNVDYNGNITEERVE